MAADFSRVRMDALADLTGVELKQGGVLLDADFNEGVAIVDRRLRALASDILGRATHSQTTPDAFLLTPAGSGFTIGRGRMYVDGLLAENHGLAVPAQREFDPLLAETRHSQPPAYEQQPWLRPAPALPASGRHLCYLDVWERELTHLEQPALVEPAVGVETSSRRQIVWQVRVLADEAPPDVTCASPDADVPGWAALIAPSSGRLSTGTFEVAGVPDPCELPPVGGYTGLENQLYRVEIHDPGQPGGTATFKWSRDNGCIASRVALVVAPGELELQSLGRDDVQRLRIGDWVEVLSDTTELAQAAGEMRRIADIDEAQRRIRLAGDLPAALLAGPGLRVRRWDQAGKVYRTGPAGSVVEVQDLDAPAATGLVAVPGAGTTLLLENGITVRFSSVGSKGFQAGDWWVFAARTADASVEILDAEPPRGMHHHYARLGFWDLAAGTISDCRGRWPPAGGGHDCSCSACVTPQSHADGSFTIQDAIDQVRQAGGGTVCLAIGQYALRAPLDLANVASLRLRGQGPGTVLVAAGGALAIRDALGVAVEQMTLIAAGSGAAITVRGVLGLALTDLVVAVLAANVDRPPAAITLAGAVAGARIARNLLLAPDGVRALDERDDDAARFLLTAALAIEDNLLWCTRSAVSLAGPVLHLLATRVERNQVLGCRQTALVLTGFGAPGSSMRVAANHVQVPAGGVACGSDGCWIVDNKLVSTDAALPSVGIELRAGLDATGADQAQLLANQIAGCTTAAVLIASPVRQLVCKLNIVERCANGLLMAEDAEGGAVAIENNQFDDIGPQTATDAAALAVGILLSRVEAATVAGNALTRVGVRAVGGGLRAALMALGVARLRAQGNRIVALAPPGGFGGLAAGVLSSGAYTQLDLLHNEIDRDADPATQPDGGVPWAAVYVTGGTANANAAATGFTATNSAPAANAATAGFAQRFGTRRVLPVDGGASIVFDGDRAFVARAAARADGGAAAVLGNVFAAASALPLVLLQAERECLFSDNRCEHVGSSGFAAVMLATQVAILSANRVRNRADIAIDVLGARTVAAVANITTGIIRVPGGLPAAMEPLNLRA